MVIFTQVPVAMTFHPDIEQTHQDPACFCTGVTLLFHPLFSGIQSIEALEQSKRHRQARVPLIYPNL
jgi:hypothetical protein